MRTSLRWTLAGTLAMTAAALYWPAAEGERVPVLAVRHEPAPAPPLVAPAAAAETLPAVLPRSTLEGEARFDPFVGVLPPPVTAPEPPPPPAPALRPVVTTAPLPTPPPLAYRFLGRMVDPGGELRVYLSRADVAVAVSEGTVLEEGYVVKAVGEDGIELHYPPLDASALIPIPRRGTDER